MKIAIFGTGMVAHVSMAHPVCPRLGDHVQAALAGQGVPHVRGGTYVVMEGPQFSTLAESQLYRGWNASVIGMTNMPEAKLAREAELCYCSVSMVTDFDCWHPGHDAVTVDSVIRVLLGNAQTARTLVAGLAGTITEDAQASECSCRHALDQALITAPEAPLAAAPGGDAVVVIDQRALPHRLQFATLASPQDVYTAIRDMWVRGAPLIGAVAAYGLALQARADAGDAALAAAVARRHVFEAFLADEAVVREDAAYAPAPSPRRTCRSTPRSAATACRCCRPWPRAGPGR